MGTESADLLVREYRLIKQTLAANDPASVARREARHQESSRCLLKRRDQAIAERINHTLCRGEIGLLFWECYTRWRAGWPRISRSPIRFIRRLRRDTHAHDQGKKPGSDCG